jgi:hypothetical protein
MVKVLLRRSRKNAYGLKNLDILTIAFKIYFNYVYLYLGRIKNIMLKLDLNELKKPFIELY